MPIIHHTDQTAEVRTRSLVPIRKLVGREVGAQQSTLWEQIMQPGEQIQLHYHEVEESITFFTGRVEVTEAGETVQFDAPATAFFPAHVWHSIRNIGSEPVRLMAFFSGVNVAVIYPDGQRKYV